MPPLEDEHAAAGAQNHTEGEEFATFQKNHFSELVTNHPEMENGEKDDVPYDFESEEENDGSLDDDEKGEEEDNDEGWTIVKGESRTDRRRRIRAMKRKKRKNYRSEEQCMIKLDKKIASLGIPGNTLEIIDALRKEFKVEHLYATLPMWGPVCHEQVENILDRPPKYQEKYIQQEASLLQKLYQIGVGSGDCIIDLGCGNGTLALVSSYIFGSSAIGVDMETPREELCAESYIPEGVSNRFRRIERNLRDAELFDELIAAATELGASRLCIVCKHLCGTGTDLCLSLVDKLQRASTFEVIGCIVATCCYHKISADLPTYIGLHGEQSPHLDQICRWTQWKATAQSDINYINPQQVLYAIEFEDMIQVARIRFLRAMFPHVKEVLFIDKHVSPHNRCMVASTRALPEHGTWSAQGVANALEELRGERWNLWPRGIVSKRFDMDTTTPTDVGIRERE